MQAKLTTEQQAVLRQVTPDAVMKVYTGKPGCGCGCNGRYWVNPAFVKKAEKGRGYTYEPRDISLREVTRVLKEVQARADEAIQQEHDGLTIYAVEDDKRFRWLFVH